MIGRVCLASASHQARAIWMETMYLVAGLAVAGLAGIAAAFYFSIRSGRGRDKRLRPAGTGRGGADRDGMGRTGPGRSGPGRSGVGRLAGGRGGGTQPGQADDDHWAGNARQDRDARGAAYGSSPARIGRRAEASSRDYQADGDTGPNPALDFGDPVLIGGRKGGPRTSAGPTRSRMGNDNRQAGFREAGPTASRRPGDRPDDRLEAQTAEDAARPRRRMGFRKGADVDEELWPAEAFGGVSDEQFWDDLASDKPLATTARSAQHDPASRKRPLDTGSATDPQPLLAKDPGQREGRGRGDGRRGPGSGAYPESRTGPNPAAERTQNPATERTMIQPAYGATQPVPSMKPQAPRPTSQAPRQASQAPRPISPTSQAPGPIQPVQTATGAVARPAETRGRRRANNAEEDPLTSAAFALRTSGPVDGRSSLRPTGSRPGGSDLGPGSMYGSTVQAMSTPPYGENYGHGIRAPGRPEEDPRRQNGSRNPARHAGAGEGTRPARQVYPQDSYPAGNHQGRDGYPGNGRQGGGPRAPYDPREDYLRLAHRR